MRKCNTHTFRYTDLVPAHDCHWKCYFNGGHCIWQHYRVVGTYYAISSRQWPLSEVKRYHHSVWHYYKTTLFFVELPPFFMEFLLTTTVFYGLYHYSTWCSCKLPLFLWNSHYSSWNSYKLPLFLWNSYRSSWKSHYSSWNSHCPL